MPRRDPGIRLNDVTSGTLAVGSREERTGPVDSSRMRENWSTDLRRTSRQPFGAKDCSADLGHATENRANPASNWN